MLDLPLVLHASPTLSGLKSASLFTHPFSNEQELRATLLLTNRTLVPNGLHLLPLCRHHSPEHLRAGNGAVLL